MISDVLSQAQAEIQRYLKEFPEVYDDEIRIIIGSLCDQMKLVQRKLDAPLREPVAWWMINLDGERVWFEGRQAPSSHNWQPLYAD